MVNKDINMNGAQDHGKSLTDEDLARLLLDDLDPSERAALLERLGGDTDARQALALAASSVDSSGQDLSEKSIGRLMTLVRESKSDAGICPHCAGDLGPAGDFCPQCGLQIRGNVLTCIRCGKPVQEDGTYCPHCGSFFRTTDRKARKGVIDSPYALFIPGLVSFIIAFAYRPLFVLFVALGCILLGAWGMDMWSRKGAKARDMRKDGKDIEEEKRRDAGRKSG